MTKGIKNFYTCSLCGKNLIQRRGNGVWRFIFGKTKWGGFRGDEPPVYIEIHGHVKMRCLRSSCRRENPDHWNIFNFLPRPIEDNES